MQLRKALHSANKQQLLPYSPQVNTSQGQHGSARSAAAPPQLPLRHSSFHRFPSHTVEAPHTQRSPTPNTPAPRDCANPSPRTRLPPNRLLCVRRGHGARAPHTPPSLPPSFRAGAERPPAPAARRMLNPGREAGRRAARRRSARFLAPLSVPGRPPHPSPTPPPPGAESRRLPRVREPRSAPAASGESRPRGAAIRPPAGPGAEGMAAPRLSTAACGPLARPCARLSGRGGSVLQAALTCAGRPAPPASCRAAAAPTERSAGGPEGMTAMGGGAQPAAPRGVEIGRD